MPLISHLMPVPHVIYTVSSIITTSRTALSRVHIATNEANSTSIKKAVDRASLFPKYGLLCQIWLLYASV